MIKTEHIKLFFITLISVLLLQNCQIKRTTNTHGINYLENRYNILKINETNLNDTRKLLGYPHAKSINDRNTWYYFERTLQKGKLHKLGQNTLKNNNVLVLEFSNSGILKQKDIKTKNDMKNLKFSKKNTENVKIKKSFVNKFLGSIRQKMYGKRKF